MSTSGLAQRAFFLRSKAVIVRTREDWAFEETRKDCLRGERDRLLH